MFLAVVLMFGTSLPSYAATSITWNAPTGNVDWSVVSEFSKSVAYSTDTTFNDVSTVEIKYRINLPVTTKQTISSFSICFATNGDIKNEKFTLTTAYGSYSCGYTREYSGYYYLKHQTIFADSYIDVSFKFENDSVSSDHIPVISIYNPSVTYIETSSIINPFVMGNVADMDVNVERLPFYYGTSGYYPTGNFQLTSTPSDGVLTYSFYLTDVYVPKGSTVFVLGILNGVSGSNTGLNYSGTNNQIFAYNTYQFDRGYRRQNMELAGNRFIMSYTAAEDISQLYVRNSFITTLTSSVTCSYTFFISSSDSSQSILEAIQNQTDSIMNAGSGFGGTTSGIQSGNESLSGYIDQYSAIEQSMHDKFIETQTALNGEFTGFSWGSLSTCLNWVGDYMQRIYLNSGDFKMMIILPLLLGIALFLIGRGSLVYGEMTRDKSMYNKDFTLKD